MSKKGWLEIAGVFVVVLTLLFGDNIYQQITGRSFFDYFRQPPAASSLPSPVAPPQTLVPTITESPSVLLSPTTVLSPVNNPPALAESPIPTLSPNISSQPPVIPHPSDRSLFGQSQAINGLVVSVGPPNYTPGCSGTLGFEVTLMNETSNPIVLSFDLEDIKLLGNGEQELSLYGEEGAATPRCYNNDFKIETLAPSSTVKFALRTTDSLGSYSYFELVFGEATGRLAGKKWRLDSATTYDTAQILFGQAISIDDLEVFVGEEDYFPGCEGTLGFQITVRNMSDRPIILSMTSDSLRLYGDSGPGLSVYSQLGRQSTDCYYGFRLETIRASDTASIAVRTTSSLSGLSYVDFVFEADNRLEGLIWRLNLPR